MCLSVFIGSHLDLVPDNAEPSSLGIELSNRVPSPLQRYPFVYFVGEKAKSDELGCSCIFAQHINWGEAGPIVGSADVSDEDERQAFDELQAYVIAAIQTKKPVSLACDDLDDADEPGDIDAYTHLIVRPEMISVDNYLFADPTAPFPWRAFHITPR